MKTTSATVSSLTLLLAALPLVGIAADSPPSLSNNPFSRPPSAVIPAQRPDPGDDDNTNQALQLQATMVGSASRLANVDGRVLQPGDEYRGYRLRAIHEGYAVFERAGQRITVYVKPEPGEDEANDRIKR